MTEEQVMAAMKAAWWDSKQIRAMSYASWKDGIAIERPCTALMQFVAIIEAATLGEKGNPDD